MLIFVVSCTTESSYQEEFELRTVLTVAGQLPADPQAACVDYMQSSESCLVSAANPPLPINETTLSSIISSGAQTTYADYCSSMLASDYFADFSPLAAECVMDCQKSYWDGRITAGSCSDDFAVQLSGQNEGSSACITDCFKLLNN